LSDKRAIVLVVIVAFAGIFGASQAEMFALMDANPTTAATTMRYLGHVTAVVSDSNGNIKAYFQTNNRQRDRGNCNRKARILRSALNKIKPLVLI